MQPHSCALAPQAPSIEELIQKAKTFVAAAKAPATLKAYINDWRDFESWCRAHPLPSLPSTENQASWPTLVPNPSRNSGPSLQVLSAGSHQVVASYSGDPSYNPSSSQPVAFTIVRASTSFYTGQSSYTSFTVSPGGAGTVSFQLDTNWNSGVAPTGTVSLTENNQVLGSTSSLYLTQALGNSGLSEYVSGFIAIQGSQFSMGANTVTIAYSGDSNYAPATATITVNSVAQPSFTLSNSGNLQVKAGATSGNTATISLTPANGFTGIVNSTCAVKTSLTNAVDLPGCALSPAALNVAGTTAVTSTLTISTTASTGAALVPGPLGMGGLTAALALLFWFGIPRRRKAWQRVVMAIALAVSIGALGCGSGGGGSGSSGGGNSGTTPGSYSIIVTGTDAATGKITAQTTVSLVVD